MAQFVISINSILKGISSSQYISQNGEYNSSIAIDPDMIVNDTDIRTGGVLIPVAYSKFSGANVDSYPVAILTTPHDTNIYVVLKNGKLISYDKTLTTETLIGTVAGGNAEGAVYYNNYIYIFGTGVSKNDVSRYGKLDGLPTLTNGVWTGVTLGSQTGLTNTAYPSIRNATLPNHWAHVHEDKIYFCDYANGQGLIHKIRTTAASGGASNDDSQYNVLDLPFGYKPVDIESWGTDIVILAMQTTDDTVNQGNAALFFWDKVSSSFYNQVPLLDPLATALLNHNGLLYIWTGNFQDGMRLSVYAGGSVIKTIEYYEEGNSPFQGAVRAYGDRIVWGSYVSYPDTAGCVWAYGSKNPKFPKGLHNIARISGTGTNPLITALNYSLQKSSRQPQMQIGWRDDAGYGIDKFNSSGNYNSVWRSQIYNINKGFKITKIELNFAKTVSANMTITPTLYFDNLSSNTALTTINNTNYSNNEKRVYIYPKNGNTGLLNFLLELKWTGTVSLPVLLPIKIFIDVENN